MLLSLKRIGELEYMLLSLKRIGELESSTGTLLPINQVKPKYNILRLVIFDNDKKEVRFEDQDFTGATAEEWRYVGNAKANKPMDKVTTTQLSYILGFDEKGENEKDNKWILRSASNIPKVGDLLNKLEWYKRDEWKGKVDKGMFKGADLYSIVVVDGGVRYELAKMKEYESYLLGESDTSQGQDSTQDKAQGSAVCQICGASNPMDNPGYTDGTILKMYIVDKKGFISGLGHNEEARLRTHTICRNCKNKLESGQRYVMDHLRVNVGKLSVYVIPSIPPNAPPGVLDSFRVEGKNWIISLGDVEKVEERTLDRAEVYDWIYNVTFLWGQPQQSKFYVTKVMYDVSIPRLMKIMRLSSQIEMELGFAELSRDNRLSLDFYSLYAITPVKESNRGVIATPYLDIVDSLLEGYQLDESLVYSHFMKELKCIRNETCQNELSGHYSLEEASLIATGFIKLFREVFSMATNSVEQGICGEVDAEAYARKLGLPPGKVGLFLLGVVTASVGREQYNKGDTKKAILDKVDFEGMDISDVRVFSDRLMEALRNYKILDRNEACLAKAIKLINEDQSSLQSSQENSFWIVSGYSWKTLQIMSHGKKEKSGTEEEQDKEEGGDE